MTLKKVWRPALAGLAVTALVVVVATFAPARALAEQFLGIFRVKHFAVVEVRADQARIEQLAGTLQDALQTYQPQAVVDEPVVRVASVEEASAQAGFQVRMPSYLPWEGDARIDVKGRTELAATIDREAVTLLLSTAGMDTSVIASDWPGGEVRAIAPAMVMVERGTEDAAVQVVQVWNAQVNYPTGLEPQLLGEAALRILGLSGSQAKRMSQSIDWTSTLLLPIPTNLASFRETEVAGEQAVLLTAGGTDPNVLLWQKDDVLYAVVARTSYETLVRVAQSMF